MIQTHSSNGGSSFAMLISVSSDINDRNEKKKEQKALPVVYLLITPTTLKRGSVGVMYGSNEFRVTINYSYSSPLIIVWVCDKRLDDARSRPSVIKREKERELATASVNSAISVEFSLTFLNPAGRAGAGNTLLSGCKRNQNRNEMSYPRGEASRDPAGRIDRNSVYD